MEEHIVNMSHFVDFLPFYFVRLDVLFLLFSLV